MRADRSTATGRHFAASVLAALALLVGVASACALCSCAPHKPMNPAWKWSQPYYAPPGANIACGSGGKACR